MNKRNRSTLYRWSVFSLVALACTGCGDNNTNRGATNLPPEEEEPVSVVFVQGAPMNGSANGMYFDAEDTLWVANAFSGTITRLDPETGEILERLGRDDGVDLADDLTFGPDGTLYWTNTGPAGNVVARPPGGPSSVIAAGIPSANPITMGDDGRLYVAQCFGDGPNGIFEIDPLGEAEPRTIRTGDPDCSSNAMDWWNGVLYSPRWFEDRVVQVDVDTGELTDVTTGWLGSSAVKFNSQGELHAHNQLNGELVKIDLATGERELLAQFPPNGWLDNLAFDSNDRLYVSSVSDGAVTEVLPDGQLREVSAGGLVTPMGVALLGDRVYVGGPQAIRGYDRASGEETTVIRSGAGFGPADFSTSIGAAGDYLALPSWINNRLLLMDPASEAVQIDIPFLAPMDVEQMGDHLLISTYFNGTVVRAKLPDLVEQEVIVNRIGFAVGLAVSGDDAYVSDSLIGAVFQIIRDGEVLVPPELVAEELAGPEGIAINGDGTTLLVAEGETSTLIAIDLASGERTNVATDLEFQPSLIPGLSEGWFNGVEVDAEGNMYVTSDGASIIYRFAPGTVAE
jgi:sugar lactone lactonase YvrE